MGITFRLRQEEASIHRKIVAQSQQLQELTDAERVAVTGALLNAGSRTAVHQRSFVYGGEMSIAALLFAVAATPVMISSPQPGSTVDVLSWSAFSMGATACALLVSRSFGKLATLKIIRWPQLFAHFLGRGYALLIPVAVVGMMLVAHHAPGVTRQTGSSDLARFCVIDIAIGLAALTTAVEWLRYRGLRRAQPQQPLDTLMLELHSVAARLGQARRTGEWTNASSRSILSSLEALAWTAEYYPPLAVRLPLADAGTRAVARQEGAKLAAVIRMHKGPVLTASGAAQLDTTEASLCRALVAWSGGDWAALTEHAPEVAVPRRWFRLWQRLWPATVLAVFAFTLPLIDALNVNQVGSSIRISLLVAAALSVVTGGVPIADKVQSAVDKSLAWRASGGK
ncbi:hypothetical protein ABH940_003162 [Streptacidiphilus sp. BW17]|uniref:hypothetical protein n=1 Tax=unclassified Streptacidiphilus TaxID=2643834 RepID=UPI00351723CB